MKIVCDTKSFTEACLNVQRSIPAKAVLPHLECLYIKTDGEDKVKLTGFDLEIAVMTFTGVRVEEEGTVLLNAKTLCDILRFVPESTLTITCNEKNICTIKSGDAEYTLISLNPEEYPELPSLTDEVPFRMNASVLKDMIKRTIFAVSNDSSKNAHRGVKFEVSAGEIKLVALDGYRLAIRKEFTDYNGSSLSFVVPPKTLNEIIKLAADDEGFIEIVKGRRHIRFTVNGYCIISKLLEGEFIDYNSTFPKTKSAVVRVNTRELINCIERTSIIITERDNRPLKCEFEYDELKLSALTALGSASDRLPVSIDGDNTKIGFNNRYLLDALRNSDTDEVLMNLNGSLSPAIIVPPESEHFLYLILPVRLKDEE